MLLWQRQRKVLWTDGRGSGSAGWGRGGVERVRVGRGLLRAGRNAMEMLLYHSWHRKWRVFNYVKQQCLALFALNMFSYVMGVPGAELVMPSAIVVSGIVFAVLCGFEQVSSCPPRPSQPILTTVCRRRGDVRVATVFRTASIHA